MGWDALSSAKKKNIESPIEDAYLAQAFKDAANEVRNQENVNTVDGLLSKGALDCSRCGYMLDVATGEIADDCTWSISKVKKMQEKSNWDFEYNKEHAWAYWSARKFLELCAEHKLSIKFL